MYCMLCTRPDWAHVASVTSRYMKNLGKAHWEAIKWVLRYLKCTIEYELLYQKRIYSHASLVGYCDSDYNRDCDKSRSLIGYVFTLFGCTVSWKASLQYVLALSTIKAKYMANIEATKEPLWLKGLIEELGVK